MQGAVTHHPHSIESAVDARWLAAWTEVCRTSEGRHEYWHRFGAYLFTDREIPRELLSLRVRLPQAPLAVLPFRFPSQRSSVSWKHEADDAAGSRSGRAAGAREGQGAGQATGGGPIIAATR